MFRYEGYRDVVTYTQVELAEVVYVSLRALDTLMHSISWIFRGQKLCMFGILRVGHAKIAVHFLGGISKSCVCFLTCSGHTYAQLFGGISGAEVVYVTRYDWQRWHMSYAMKRKGCVCSFTKPPATWLRIRMRST